MGVNALARVPAALGGLQDGVAVTEGSVTDMSVVERALSGCTAVVSVLGRDRDSPNDLMTAAAVSLVMAMRKRGITRLVVLTNTAVEDAGDNLPLLHRILRRALSFGNGRLKRDSVGAASIIADSGLDWTLVRAPLLTDGPKRGRYRVGALAKGMPLRVSRADVADFILSCVAEGRFLRERPAIGG